MVRDARIERLDKYGHDVPPALAGIVRKSLRRDVTAGTRARPSFARTWRTICSRRAACRSRRAARVLADLSDASPEAAGAGAEAGSQAIGAAAHGAGPAAAAGAPAVTAAAAGRCSGRATSAAAARTRGRKPPAPRPLPGMAAVRANPTRLPPPPPLPQLRSRRTGWRASRRPGTAPRRRRSGRLRPRFRPWRAAAPGRATSRAPGRRIPDRRWRGAHESRRDLAGRSRSSGTSRTSIRRDAAPAGRPWDRRPGTLRQRRRWRPAPVGDGEAAPVPPMERTPDSDASSRRPLTGRPTAPATWPSSPPCGSSPTSRSRARPACCASNARGAAGDRARSRRSSSRAGLPNPSAPACRATASARTWSRAACCGPPSWRWPCACSPTFRGRWATRWWALA